MPEGQPHWYDFPAIDWETLFHPTFGYLYFREPLQIPDASRAMQPSRLCTPLTAAWLADAAMLAYGRSGAHDMTLLEFDEILDRVQLRGHRIGNWDPDAKSVKAFFAYNSQFAVLSFRGTRKINWVNSAVDMAAFSARAELAVHSPETSMNRELDSGDENSAHDAKLLVHSGFQFALDTVWRDISLSLEAYRQKYPPAPVFFTGHSLGAAFATMSVGRFEGGGAALYTFGSPRVGNSAFCEQVHKRADLGICRFVNNRDLMTTVPPRDKSYVHTCGLLHIGPDGSVATDSEMKDPPSASLRQVLREAATAVRDYVRRLPPPVELVDHAQRRYCYYLWRWARNGQIP